MIKHFTASNSPLTYDVIHDIMERDNQLWVATDGGGINIISLDDFSFTNIQQKQDDVHSFPANTIYRLYLDPANNMWAGSIRRGLIGIKNVYACSYQNVPFGNLYGLSNQTINSFFQDSDGIVWVGTDGEVSTGLIRYRVPSNIILLPNMRKLSPLWNILLTNCCSSPLIKDSLSFISKRGRYVPLC